ncbi:MULTISPECIES: RodZ domain-containing protein [Modicisalibacter]|uniref:Helix-turn-helix domain-containing protein n=1 Tax=Modicisalibacter tunisiensis TaxID=390637 RepID=A0ABS7WYE5_9GAMM|nr:MULTISPECIES: RodZ domain-containing protein [Modicisalibacter]MBZ9567658.1 helix-turn-helix domain-containing protein [Modicisalibacter tunisiensis]
MSDTQQRQEGSLDPAVGTAPESPGEVLRRERENQGLSIDEVATQLNLRPAVVSGLEADRYDEIPVAAYRRGYLRAYARLMGIDEASVVGAYNRQHGDTRSDIERKITPVNTTRPPSRLGAWVFKLFTLLVIVGLIGLSLLWWQSRNGNDLLGLGGGDEAAATALSGEPAAETGAETDTPDATTDLPPLPDDAKAQAADAEPAASASAPTGDTAVAGATADTAGTAETSATPSAPADGTAADTADTGSNDAPAAAATDTASATTDTAAEDQTPTADTARRLAFTFNEQSWTEIHDANDKRILVGLQPAGSQTTVEGQPPFRLTIGNASGVELTWHGETVDLGAHTGGNNVARFTLGE